MAVVSDWIQPDNYEVPLPFRTGLGRFRFAYSEFVYDDSGAPFPAMEEWREDDVEHYEPVARWRKLVVSPPDSVFGADDAEANTSRVLSRYSHSSEIGIDVVREPPAPFSSFERQWDDNFLTMWITSFPAQPVVPPAEIPEGAIVEYESPAGVFDGDPVWEIQWAGRNHNSGNPVISPEVQNAEFFLHRMGPVSYPSLPSHRPTLADIAATQPIVDSLIDPTDSSVVDDTEYNSVDYSSKTTFIEARPTIAGQFAVTVRPRLWTGPTSSPIPYNTITSEPAGDWRGATTISYRTGRVLSVVVRQRVRPPRYRFVWPGGQYRLRQRQTLPGSDGWPLRQRQNGAHSGSWPLRQRQTGV